MKYFAMRGSQDINKNRRLCNNICFKFFSKEMSCRLHSTLLSAGKPNILGCFENLLEINVYKALSWVKKLSLREYSWERLSCILIRTVPRLASKWVLQHVSNFWKMGGLITYLEQVCTRSSSSLEHFQDPALCVHTGPMGNRLTPELCLPMWHGMMCPFAEGPQLVQRGPMRCTLKCKSYLKSSTSCLFQLCKHRSQSGQYCSKWGRGREQIWSQDCL